MLILQLFNIAVLALKSKGDLQRGAIVGSGQLPFTDVSLK